LRRGGAVPAFEREEPLVQILNELIDPPLECALAELQLLESSGQLPELLLDSREAHLEPGEPTWIIGLDQLHRSRGIESAVHPVDPHGKPRRSRVSLACGEPEKTGPRCKEMTVRCGVHGSCPWASAYCVAATTVTARRFCDHAVSV
jgi:hypothetical protein